MSVVLATLRTGCSRIDALFRRGVCYFTYNSTEKPRYLSEKPGWFVGRRGGDGTTFFVSFFFGKRIVPR